MAEFGVGGQPATAPPGWYPDPSGRARLRWWSGARWEWWLSDGVGRALDPAAPPDSWAPARELSTPGISDSRVVAAPRSTARQDGLERAGRLPAPLTLTATVLGPLATTVAFAGLYVLFEWDGSLEMFLSLLFLCAALASGIGLAGLVVVAVAASRSRAPRQRTWPTVVCTVVNVAAAACLLGWWFNWWTWADMAASDLPLYLYTFGVAAVLASAPWCWLWFRTLKNRDWAVRLSAAVAPTVAYLVVTWVWAVV